jgi:hypothetical protein
MIARRNLGALMIGVLAAAACQSTEAPRRHAVLAAADSATMEKLKAVLAAAMSTAQVELGPGDLTQTSTVSVLPPRLGPYEGRSPALPTQFDIMMRGAKCLLVRRDTGAEYELVGVACRPLSN